MPSESIASFLELARENNLLGGEDVDALFQQPDVPQRDLAALCDFLQKRGVLTGYQAEMIRAGKGYELNFAGYPIGAAIAGTLAAVSLEAAILAGAVASLLAALIAATMIPRHEPPKRPPATAATNHERTIQP